MTKSKFYFSVLILVFLVIIAWTSYVMINGEKEEKPYRISVIVNDSSNDRWIALHLGLVQAARDYNVDLNYVSTEKLASVKEEMELIDHELKNGAEGIIVQMFSSEVDEQKIAEIDQKAAMILLESDISPEDQYTLAGPDNIKIGKSLADAVKQDFGENLVRKKIGILSGNQRQFSMQQRLQGLKDELEKEAVDIIWEIAQAKGTEIEKGTELEQMEAVDILIALENDETERMVDYLQTGKLVEENCFLYGVGCSEKAVYYLDKGVIKTMVIPNEFNLGYQSMEAVVKQLEYHLEKAEGSQVDYLVVNRMNLYEEENQKVLFPIVQ